MGYNYEDDLLPNFRLLGDYAHSAKFENKVSRIIENVRREMHENEGQEAVFNRTFRMDDRTEAHVTIDSGGLTNVTIFSFPEEAPEPEKAPPIPIPAPEPPPITPLMMPCPALPVPGKRNLGAMFTDLVGMDLTSHKHSPGNDDNTTYLYHGGRGGEDWPTNTGFTIPDGNNLIRASIYPWEVGEPTGLATYYHKKKLEEKDYIWYLGDQKRYFFYDGWDIGFGEEGDLWSWNGAPFTMYDFHAGGSEYMWGAGANVVNGHDIWPEPALDPTATPKWNNQDRNCVHAWGGSFFGVEGDDDFVSSNAEVTNIIWSGTVVITNSEYTPFVSLRRCIIWKKRNLEIIYVYPGGTIPTGIGTTCAGAWGFFLNWGGGDKEPPENYYGFPDFFSLQSGGKESTINPIVMGLTDFDFNATGYVSGHAGGFYNRAWWIYLDDMGYPTGDITSNLDNENIIKF